MKEEIKQTMKEEKRKLKDMTFKEKREYIWEYYKLHIIGILVVVFMTGSIINTVWINPPKKTFVNFVYFRAYVDSTRSDLFTDHLTEELVIDKEKEKVYFTNFSISNEEYSEVDLAIAQKFAAMTAAKELDVIVVDQQDFDDMTGINLFMDLNETFNENELAAFGDQVVSIIDEETGVTVPYVIRIDGNALLEAYGLPTEGYVIGIVSNSEKIANAGAILRYILQ